MEITSICFVIVVIFAFIGHKISLRVSSETFLRTVYALIAVAGLANVVRAFVK
jgi:uncharacterized membrane protein YfcA